jgi:hypothetical protein
LDEGIDKLKAGEKLDEINRVVGIISNKMVTMSIDEALKKPKFFDCDMYNLVNSLTTSR